MEFLIGWAVFACATASVAKSQGRNMFMWAGVGLLLGPFAILIVALMGAASPEEKDDEENSGQ